ncbi:hypothetical protein HDU98_003269 [Podochytrium sp. JEL0797]|nr:hypothetical protein HDU98_003269 [Podochytrium sp. JEL0797]
MDALCNFLCLCLKGSQDQQQSSQQQQQQQQYGQSQQQQPQYGQQPQQQFQQPPYPPNYIEMQPPSQGPFLPADSTPTPKPTAQQIASLSAAIAALWSLDTNRLSPGTDFHLNLQAKTYVSNEQDRARDPLFTNINTSQLFAPPTYAAFLALLQNFTAEDGVAEKVSAARTQQEMNFIRLISQTKPIQFLHAYLIEKNLSPQDPAQFHKQLHKIWFGLYKRVVQNDTCAFEHTFAGEIRDGEVIGFHNWVTFAVEEKSGRADYRGFILSKSAKNGHSAGPTGREHVLGLQLAWKGDVKPVSTFLMGVSPEYELALYTMVFLVGKDEEQVPIVIDGVECKVIVHRFTNREGRQIGSAYVSID